MTRRGSGPVPDQFTPLTPAVFHILLALCDGPLHGYAIMKAVAGTGAPGTRMGPGTIYGSIQRMERSGLVEERGPAADGKRRLYGLTALGEKALEAESARIARLADVVRAKGLIPGEA